MAEFLTCLVAVILSVSLLSTIFRNGIFARNDTDEPNGKRSDLTLYTDYRTGCQYVGTALGGITARLDKNGKPMCVELEQQECSPLETSVTPNPSFDQFKTQLQANELR